MSEMPNILPQTLCAAKRGPHMPTMRRFSHLLGRMDRMLMAERELETDPGPLDRPAFDALLRAGEAERTSLVAEAEGLLDLSPGGAADAALQRLALLLLMDLTAVDTEDCRRLHGLAADDPGIFHIAGHSADAQQARAMQRAFFTLFDGLGALAEFGGEGWAREQGGAPVPIPA